MRNLRIVFFGTPEFAVPSLEILLENGFDVAGVVTATDKPGARDKKALQESPVKKCAREAGLPILQPPNLKSPDFLASLAALEANLQVVVAFRMLPESVFAMPEFGTFNLHGSLLPKYRGAAPINWAIIRGEKETGVTTFFLNKEIDTGSILFQESLPIGDDETAGELHDRMMHLGARLVLKTAAAIAQGPVAANVQNETEVTLAPKIFRETCQIDFSQSTVEVHNFIRGMSPSPGAWMWYRDQEIKIFRAEKKELPPSSPPGTVHTDQKSSLLISTLDGAIGVLELQLAGRRRMGVKEFLNGFGNLFE
ncbi:MAG: methionyl-tRNA formyltransferase [Haliscomenobacter sp.]|nr:methionyl-tRNA formyltransferase [Haliscomenobacter sp.]